MASDVAGIGRGQGDRESAAVKLKREPHKAKPIHGKDAWWYENAQSIDVYVDGEGVTLACRIPRTYLQGWIERTEE